MKEKINLGFIGLGQRGRMLFEEEAIKMDDINIVALCDAYEDRAHELSNVVKEKKGNEPLCTTDYREVLELPGLDAVIISAAWEAHVDIAIAAMKKHIAVGSEVGGAYSIDDCWRLVHTYEETKTPIMMLENCCYAKRELLMLKMVKMGLFGEIVHVRGAYRHDLREEVAKGLQNRHYRFRNYEGRNCDNYPTHEIGPIAKILDINNGNRFLTLVSMSSNAVGIHEYIEKNMPESKLDNVKFRQGAIITTMIKCAGGETVIFDLDTTLPRPYSRGFEVHGSKGIYIEDTDLLCFDGEHEKGYDKLMGSAKQYDEKYAHPLWKDYDPNDSHGGMDWHVISAFKDSLKYDLDMPIDVYDMATWMSISTLSEQSIALGSQPVYFPDFTNGKWLNRKKSTAKKYSLTEIYE